MARNDSIEPMASRPDSIRGSAGRWLRSPPGFVLVVLVVLGAVEAGLRLGLGYGNPRLVLPDDELGYRLQPGQVVQGPRGTTERINSKGYREREFSGPVPALSARGPRIVVLGDSVSYGVGVDAAQTWPHQLERGLHAQGYQGAQVLCLSVPGYTAEQMLRTYARDGERLRPDVVAIELTSYSIRPMRQLSEPHQFPLANALRRTAVWDFLRRKHWARPGADGLRLEQAVLTSPHAPENEARWRLCESMLKDLARSLHARGALLVIVATPRLDLGLDPTREEPRWRDFAQASQGLLYVSAAQSLHARLKPLLAEFQRQGLQPSTAWKTERGLETALRASQSPACFLPGDSPHLDEIGHEVVAGCVLSAMKDWLLAWSRVVR